MMAYFYAFLSFVLTLLSFYLLMHRHTTLVRATGMILAYLAAAIALKAYYLLAG